MGTVIYSASPFQAMLGPLGTVLFILGIGIIGIGVAIFRRNQSRGARIGIAAAGAFLLIVGIVYAGITLASASSGAQTVTVFLNNKTIAEDNCGDNGETCTRYVLETSNPTDSYDFNVPSEAYDVAQVNTCYDVSFYASKSPFSVAADTSSYHQVNSVTRIEVADAGACQ
jgi:hypothetical protein